MKQINKNKLYLIKVALNRLLMRFAHEQDYYETLPLRKLIADALDNMHLIDDEILNARLSELQNCLFDINNNIVCLSLKKALFSVERYLFTRNSCDFNYAIESCFYGVK